MTVYLKNTLLLCDAYCKSSAGDAHFDDSTLQSWSSTLLVDVIAPSFPLDTHESPDKVLDQRDTKKKKKTTTTKKTNNNKKQKTKKNKKNKKTQKTKANSSAWPAPNHPGL